MYIYILYIYSIEYPFGQFRPAALSVSPPKFLPTTSLLTEERGRVEKIENINAVQVLFSNSQNCSVLSTLFKSQIQNTELHNVL